MEGLLLSSIFTKEGGTNLKKPIRESIEIWVIENVTVRGEEQYNLISTHNYC